MAIVLRNISKAFGEHVVVNDVSLEIADGELLVLLGSSGSGKSTLLRMIAGLISPDTGVIELHGRDVTNLPPQQRDTGFVFQHYALFRNMSVAANVEFGLRVRKVPLVERRKRRETLLELVGLEGLGTRYPSELSGGQRQRVALARALAFKPTVLLLDEPFGALDVRIRSQLRRNLRDIQAELKVTTILVTHDQDEAFELASRVGVIERGKLIEVGTPASLYHHPRTEFVASFVGRGNVLSGWIQDGKIRLGQRVLALPKEAPLHEEGAPVRILCRPENVILQKNGWDSQEFLMGTGVIKQVIFAGAVARTLVELEGLEGVRAIMPPPAYGRNAVNIEALVASNASGLVTETNGLHVGQQVQVGFRQVHILEPTGISIVIHAEDTQPGAIALKYGLDLAAASRGPALLFDSVREPTQVLKARERLERLKAGSPLAARLETRIRQGNSSSQLSLELQTRQCDLLVMGWDADRSVLGQGRSARTAREALLLGVGVLLVQRSALSLKRMLICTAAGEPGKRDVSFGGRIARRLGAQAVVLHVLQRASQEERIRRHLAQAQATLMGLGVRSEIELVSEYNVVDTIADTAENKQCDMIVIGAPLGADSYFIGFTDFVRELLAKSTRPLLIVPLGA